MMGPLIALSGDPTLKPNEPSSQLVKHLPVLHVPQNWHEVLAGHRRDSVAEILPAWLANRRWFAGKARTIQNVTLIDVIPLNGEHAAVEVQLSLVQVKYVDDVPETYLLPVGFAQGQVAAKLIADNSPSLLARLQVSTGKPEDSGVLFDAFGDENFGQLLLDIIGRQRNLLGHVGSLVGHPLPCFRSLRGPNEEKLAIRLLKVEQSNSSGSYGDRVLLKLFRRLEQGVNPDLEIGRFLTEQARFPHSPAVAGWLEYRDVADQPATVGILQAYVRNEGDAWAYTLENVHRFFERVRSTRPAESPFPANLPANGLVAASRQPIGALARELCDTYLESASLMGQRTAEMHLALASVPENPEFAPEQLTELDQRSLDQNLRSLARKTFRLLREKVNDLSPECQAKAESLLILEQDVVDRFRLIVGRKMNSVRIRCHGDYHLGQVLFTGKDFVIMDFEGEPARPLGERRLKRPPLRDVAGMLRSFDYAAQTVLMNQIAPSVQKSEFSRLQEWALFWSQWISTQFVSSYLATIRATESFATSDDEVQMLLDLFLLEKAIYELGYELNNRPAWVQIPLGGILRLLLR